MSKINGFFMLGITALTMCFIIGLGCIIFKEYKESENEKLQTQGIVKINIGAPVYKLQEHLYLHRANIEGHEYLIDEQSHGFYGFTHNPDCKLCYKKSMDKDMAMLLMIRNILRQQKQERETISIAGVK